MTPSDETDALRSQLVQARQALEEFNHSVSHDLRAPLRHVRSYLQIVQEDLGGDVDATLRDHLRTASDAAILMGRMLDALLDLSRLRAAELQLAPCQAAGLVDEAVRQVSERAGNGGLTVQVAPDLPVLKVDAVLVRQLLQHLIDNAIKFSRAVAAPEISIGWFDAQPGWCEMYIRDNGVGFEPRFTDACSACFSACIRRTSSMASVSAWRWRACVVERHGGGIRVRGDLNPGCEVRFTLPLAEAGVPG